MFILFPPKGVRAPRRAFISSLLYPPPLPLTQSVDSHMTHNLTHRLTRTNDDIKIPPPVSLPRDATARGWNALRPGKGTLGETPEFADFPGETVVIPIDLERRTATPPWSNGVEIPLNATGTGPFFGQMGVAPAPALGELTSILPGTYGGNLDNKRLGPGWAYSFPPAPFPPPLPTSPSPGSNPPSCLFISQYC